MKFIRNKFWLFAGILMVITGVLCIFLVRHTIENKAGLIGAALIAIGIINIIHMIDSGNRLPGTGWVLYDAIINIILGLYLISSNRLHVLVTLIPYFFAIFMIAKGIASVIDANQARIVLDRYWFINLIIGVVAILYGILCAIRPVVGAISLGGICGIALAVSGVSSIFMWLFEVRFRRKIKGYIRIYGNDLGRFKDEHPDEYSSLEEMLDVQL